MTPEGIQTYALEDLFFRKRVEQIIAEYRIDTVIETGINEGRSSVEFCEMVPRYIGIDIDRRCILSARERLIGTTNSLLIEGNSPDVLRAILPGLFAERTMFFLDAHCFKNTNCPLLEEMRTIPRGKGVLIFHDIWVPGRSGGGFSPLINGVPIRFDYALIEGELKLWSPNHRVEYMKEYTNDLFPGVMFAFPK